MEAAEQAVIDAMIKYGPDGHIDGFHEITLAALKAAAPYMQPPNLDVRSEWEICPKRHGSQGQHLLDCEASK